MNKVYILAGLRSHVGVRGGIFRDVLPERLGAGVLRGLGLSYDLEKLDGIFCGNAVGPGGNIGRLTALTAGLPETIPAVTLDLQCASALAAVEYAALKIAAGDADFLAAGGTESSSLAPEKRYVPRDPRSQVREPLYHCAQFIPGEISDNAMLLGAERAAAFAGITREEADKAALESQRRAVRAEKAGVLFNVILPLFGSTRDEAIRPKLNEKVMKRAPVISGFPGGILTAANACTINDGAAFLLLCSEKFLKENGLKPRAEILGTAAVGGDPARPPLICDAAAGAAIKKCGLSYEELSAFEYNEAFSVIDVLFSRAHPAEAERLNQFGGALAYGHPYGASGAIILLHLLRVLEETKGNYGTASIAAAGGVGESVVIRTIHNS